MPVNHSLRSLLAAFICAAAAFPAAAAEPLLLTHGAIGGVLLDGGSRVLCYNGAREFWTVDVATGDEAPWSMDWQPEDGGMSQVPDMYPKVAASPDGRTVVIASYVTFANTVPGAEYPHMAYLLVQSGADGADAAPVSFVDATDGGPMLDFALGGRYLIGPWFTGCEPTVAAYNEWYSRLMADAVEPDTVYPNALDCAARRPVYLAALPDTEWGVDKSPYSDQYVYDAMDSADRIFGDLAAPGGQPLVWTPPDAGDWFFRTQWAGPDKLLAWCESGQRVITASGESWLVPGGQWEHYCMLPDGRSFFSRDGGATIETGRIDWRSGDVPGATARPDLAPFAVTLDDNHWPKRYDTWMPLPDSSGAVVFVPDAEDGRIYLVGS